MHNTSFLVSGRTQEDPLLQTCKEMWQSSQREMSLRKSVIIEINVIFLTIPKLSEF